MKDDNKSKISLKSRESNYAEISKRRFLSRFNNNDNNSDDNTYIKNNIRNCTRNTNTNNTNNNNNNNNNNTNYIKNVDLHSTIIKNIHLIVAYAILVISRSIS